MTTAPLIQIIIGSTRAHRRADSIGRWFATIAEGREDLATEVVDLRELDLPFLSDAKPIGFVSYGGAGGGIRASEQLRQVDRA